ncbi:MAG TPA: Calx-beta domain-containing protein, partial [Pyrinomonadaceae bacterium]|nr:Calx-beta domain-containing protein [Pyrinomonadaceae bacterium]
MRKAVTFLAAICCALLLSATANGQTTYTWTPALESTDYQLAANWNPARVTTAPDDILVIDGGATPSPIITNLQTESIGQLKLINNANPTISAMSPSTLTISGGSGTDFEIEAGSFLIIDGSDAVTITLAGGATASVAGSITVTGGAHQLTAASTSAITFQSGGIFTTAAGFSGHAFGTTSLDSIIFASGSQYVHNAGSDPFGATAPDSVVVFQSGSTYIQRTSGAPSASGRTYANLTLENGASWNTSGSGDFQFQTLSIEAGSSFTHSGSGAATVTIKGDLNAAGTGNISIAAGAGGIQINSGSAQTFGGGGGSGSIAFNSPATIGSGTTVNLSRGLSTAGLNVNGTLNCETNTVSGAGSFTLASGATLGIGDPDGITASGTSGNIQVTGSRSFSDNANYAYNGGALQATGSGLPSSVNNLTINNSSGFSLSNSVSVNGTLNLLGGNILTGANTLSVASGASVNRAGGHLIGNLKKIYSGPGSFTYHVGTANGYSPVVAQVTAGSGDLIIRANQGRQPNIPGANALQRYWTLAGTGITADLIFQYSAGDVVGTEANYQLIKYDGGFSLPGGSVDAVNHLATINGVSTFSDWTLADPNAVSSGTLQLSSSAYSVNEDGVTATITVTRTGGSGGAVSAQYETVAGGTATAGSDYTSATGTVEFADGDAADKTFTISITDDSQDEADETVNLALSDPAGGATLGTQSTAVLTIMDNDDQPSLTISNVSVTEGNSGTSNAVFTVSVSAASGRVVMVDYATADDTATTANSDYQPASGTLTFNAGETSKSVTVVVNGDTAVEPNETFKVNLSNAVNASIATGQGTGTITNDDGANLSVAMTDSPDPVTAGNFITYTITVANNGPDNATGVTLSDTLPVGVTFISASAGCSASSGVVTCSLGSLANGANKVVMITVLAPTTATSVSNTATVTSSVTDPDTGNNSATESTAVSAAACVAPPTGMISWLPADGNTNDIIGPNNGTLRGGATYITGKVGQAFSVNGSSDTVSLPVGLRNAFSAMTIDAWVRPSSHGAATGGTFGWTIASNTDGGDGFALRILNGFIQSDLRLSSGDARHTFNQAQLPLNQWSHIALTYDGSSVKAYLNGQLLESVPTTGTVKNTNNPNTCPMIGNEPLFCDVQSGDFGFRGGIDEVEFFDRALSATEVQSLYNASSAGKCRAGKLQFSAAAYNINEGAGLATITVTRVNGSDGEVSVNYATSNGTATAGSDYTATSGTLTFANGEAADKTFTIPITNDSLDEGLETVNLTLSNPAGGALLGSPSTALLTIIDDDSPADLSVMMADSPDPVTAGNFITYTITVANNGPDNATGVTLSDTLPAGSSFVSASAGCSASSGVVTCSLGSIANGANKVTTITATAPITSGMISNTVSVSGTEADPDTGNNTTTESTAVSAAACVAPPTGMISWLPADGNTNDIIGPNNGTLRGGATYITGKVGAAFVFNSGVTDAVSLPSAGLHDAFSALTIDAWVNPASHGADNLFGGILGRTIISNTEDGHGYALRILNGFIQSDLRLTGGTARHTFNQAQLPLNAWSHIALTYDGSSVKAYLNGQLLGSVAASGQVMNSNNGQICSMIGNEPEFSTCQVTGQGLGWLGGIDELEIFNRALSAAEVQSLYNASRAGKCRGGSLQFNAATYSVNENGGSASITVTRTGGSIGTVSVNYATSDSTATAGSDYTSASGTLTFAEGETSKSFTIPITDDLLDEADETVNLALSDPAGGATLGAQSTAVLTITDNDAQPSLAINDVTVMEGNSGTTNAVFTVNLSAASGQAVTVSYATADGTATTADNDYQSASGTLTFNAGETSKSITVMVNGDTAVEPDETFTVNLSDAVNASITDGEGTGTITNDDAHGTLQFSAAAYSVNEGDGTATITVTRTGGSSGAVSAQYET